MVSDAKRVCSSAWGASIWGDLFTTNPDYRSQVLSALNVSLPQAALFALWDGKHFSHTCQIQTAFSTLPYEEKLLTAVMLHPLTADLTSLEELFRKAAYKGPVVIGEGLPCIGILSWLYPPLFELLGGEFDPGCMPVLRSGYSLAVRLCMPPFPFLGEKWVQPLPEWEKGMEKHLWLHDVTVQHVGVAGGDLGWVTAFGVSPRECKKRVSRTIETLSSLLPYLMAVVPS